ncbi:RteC domain-containing protein [Dysgonomonas sp. BGC7]|uniref:RteC domain-containing protein n=1 Tax=Dysgonomonas sp. BGC7 TaxID=1658008 RepID=UPI000A501CCE|nr:RteC domain-containing protein [Dysgonomonas sp. BGC7]MBD8388884.1 RteC domain-containing protein [Dysgonomonas sp. BGC7]
MVRSWEKKSIILNYITHCLSFLTAALEWTEHNHEPVSTDTYHKTKLSSSGYYIWGGSITDLIELAIAIYNIKLIRKASGKLISFAEIIHGLKLIFNIKIPKNIYSRKTRTMERKKNSSSMLERLLAVYKNEVDQLYK